MRFWWENGKKSNFKYNFKQGPFLDISAFLREITVTFPSYEKESTEDEFREEHSNLVYISRTDTCVMKFFAGLTRNWKTQRIKVRSIKYRKRKSVGRNKNLETLCPSELAKQNRR
jgi:hypothetical protein